MSTQEHEQVQASREETPDPQSYRRVLSPDHTQTKKRLWYWLAGLFLIPGLLFQTPLLVISGLLLLIVLISVELWARWSLRYVTYTHRLSQTRARFGERITMEMAISNAKLLPVPWLEVEVRLPSDLFPALPAGARARLNNMLSLRWYERVKKTLSIHCLSRGVYTFGPVVMRSGDAFGFVNEDVEVDYRSHLVIYPAILPVESFLMPSRRPFGERSAPRRLLEDPLRIVGVRDYVSGDSLKQIHWKASARTTTLQSKVYEASTTYSLALFVDAKMSGGSITELGISAAASIAEWAFLERYPIGLYSNTSLYSLPGEPRSSAESETTLPGIVRKMVRIPPSRHPEQRTRILEALARLLPFAGVHLEELLLKEGHRLNAGTTVLVITSSVNEQLSEALSRLRQRGHATVVLFAGDVLPPLKLHGTRIHYLGGSSRWESMLTSFQDDQEEALKGFRFS